ncbi:MAG TPA: hypothetical protein DHW71_03965 [Gammaproteobacteria bacterium]|nr:hypothetical protein [Gammaproteobacteria bacterium]HBF07518.1 hypothetical protein [Gammaproteobacteria bacterium]HCK92116.1 hypothetical protein [Gammaproteobacteria bacterium]|tara:strand:- start:802 stop:1788 length:987 start_codon:yes stop_codon:yes gene_type:complete
MPVQASQSVQGQFNSAFAAPESTDNSKLGAISKLAKTTLPLVDASAPMPMNTPFNKSSESLVLAEPTPEQVKLAPKASKPNCLYTLARKTFRGIFKLDNIHLDINGLENVRNHKGGAVLVANHHSLTDGLMVGAKLKEEKIHFVAKAELFNSPIGGFLKSVGAIPMDRAGGKGSADSLAAVKEKLAKGEKVCFFPEGTLSKDGAIHKGKTGIGRLLLESGADYIPVGIRGPSISLSPTTSKDVEVTFGKPVSINALVERSQKGTKSVEDVQKLVAGERSDESKQALEDVVSTVMHDIQDTLNGDRKEGSTGFVPYVDNYSISPNAKKV